MKNRILAILSLVIVLFAGCAMHAEIPVVTIDNHDLKLKLDVPAHAAEISDAGMMQVKAGWNLLFLNSRAAITDFTLGGQSVDYVTVPSGDSVTLPAEVTGTLPPLDLDGEPLLVLFRVEGAGTLKFQLSYRAEFFQDVGNIRFSNEMVGTEVSGTILDEGAYLSSMANFYPNGNEGLAEYRLTADIPADWECVSNGNQIGIETRGERKIVSFVNPFRTDGLTFMAAPFVVATAMADDIEVACYFFEADTALIPGYLSATVDYIKMYSELVGPYPYERFAVVENFFPTGYGMPAWTLLGQQVLRLPFIKSTSLGHEVLHNWWGNSVYVDDERGNWCEAATVYGADYRYKLQRSEAAAMGYRKDILKQYVSYVNDGNDFPIRQFTSRTSPNTRTIGYSKAMMVYHMIEQEIGTKAFFDAWKIIYERHRTEKISWEEWLAAFAETSGQDLGHIIPQWIDQAGAPLLSLEVSGSEPTGESKTISLVIAESSGKNYHLNVPLRFTGDGVVIDTSVVVRGASSEFSFVVPASVQTVELDPDCHLFRRLYPEEVEPIISAVMGLESKRFFANDADPASDAYRAFGDNLSGDSISIETFASLAAGSAECAPVLFNPEDLPDYLVGRVMVVGDSITVDGVNFPKAGHTAVLAGDNWRGFEKFMVIISDDAESLPRIGQLVPHYGKYSYLVFDGARNVGKGQWRTDSSPLKKSL